MKKDHRDAVVGSWAEEKLDTLEAYLSAYAQALSKSPFRLSYIDAFAGSPLARIRTRDRDDVEPTGFFNDDETAAAQERFILGSPMRALRCSPGFHLHFFCDLDETRIEVLRDLTRDRTGVKVRVGDCNQALRELAPHLSGKRDKAVAFLDPYGAHLEWATLEALANTRNIEVIINFPVAMAINRLITKDGDVPERWEAQLDACFGTREWREAAYREEPPDLFGHVATVKPDGAADRLHDLYRRRLGGIFPHVAPSRLIRNTRGAPLYYLIWAGPHPLGAKIAADVFSRFLAVGKAIGRGALKQPTPTR